MNATHPQNNFDFLRFVAATMVWYEHCFALYDHSGDPLSLALGYESFGGLGVAMFFIISGYFVTLSYLHHNRLGTYIKNRALRILPALIVAVLFSVFVLGPLVTSLSVRSYFSDTATWNYLKCMLILPVQYDLPGVFTHLASPHVNGSLWTLQHELRCYVAVGVLGVLGILRPRLMIIVFVTLWAAIMYGVFANDLGHLPHIAIFSRWSWGKMQMSVELATLFASGAVLYGARDLIPLKFSGFIVALLVLAASYGIKVAGYSPILSRLVFDLAFPYIVIYLGFLRLPLLSHFGRFGDFSYGLYLYAFPLQNLTLFMFPHIGFHYFMGLSFAMSLAAGVLSWHLVEKPMLGYKR